MKPTQALQKFRKLTLTTKDVNKGFYKGTRTGSMGSHTKWGGYKIDYKKVRTYVVPEDLKSFTLTPFVTQNVKPLYGMGAYNNVEGGPKNPESYLQQWKEDNGRD